MSLIWVSRFPLKWVTNISCNKGILRRLFDLGDSLNFQQIGGPHHTDRDAPGNYYDVAWFCQTQILSELNRCNEEIFHEWYFYYLNRINTPPQH